MSSTKSSEGLLAALHLVWAVSVNVCSTTHSAQHLDKLLQEEEMLLDWTFKHGGVEFLTGMLLKSTAFFQEVRRGILQLFLGFFDIVSRPFVVNCYRTIFVLSTVHRNITWPEYTP